MAKSSTKGAGAKSASGKSKATENAKSAPRKALSGSTRSKKSSDDNGNAAVDMFVKLLQSPIVADMLAVAATAALVALAEHGFNSKGAHGKKGAGRAVKEAGKAAAAAIGRRLSTEVDEIRKAAKGAKADA